MTATFCPCCDDRMSAGHNPMTIFYRCPDCGEEWDDYWCSAVDGDCPSCDARNIEPVAWECEAAPVFVPVRSTDREDEGPTYTTREKAEAYAAHMNARLAGRAGDFFTVEER